MSNQEKSNLTPRGEQNELNKNETAAETAVGGDVVHGDKTTVGDISDSEAVAIGRGAVANSIKNFFFGEREDVIHLRNRQTMLQLVKSTWIKGVLEQSLHNAVLIDLNMETRVDAVEYPWDMIIRRAEQDDEPFPEGTKIADAFNQMNQSLLILGEPGSGKTTMLLELGRQLISRAEQDPTLPIPVVFNLSSWAEKRQPFADWLVDEFNTKYRIPKKVSQRWIENDELLLLLDGLDEVQQEHREACVNAVNIFRQNHLVPLTICSRTIEYKDLSAQLKLEGAIVLLPLTEQQIDNYLKSVGDRLQAVQAMLEQDATLQEFVQSPLTLNIMTLAYQGVSIEELKFLESVDARRKHLFNSYISKMFARSARTVNEQYPKDHTVRWLQWLATRLIQNGQTVFLIERMQPNWAYSTKRSRFAATLATLMWGPIYGLIFGLFGGLGLTFIPITISWNREAPSDELISMINSLLTYGVYIGLFVGLISGVFDRLSGKYKVIELEGRSYLLGRRIKGSLCLFFFWMLIASLSLGLIDELSDGLYGPFWMLDAGLIEDGLRGWLLGGLFFGVTAGTIGGFQEVKLVDTFGYSWHNLKFNLLNGLFVGLVGTSIIGLSGLLMGPLIVLLVNADITLSYSKGILGLLLGAVLISLLGGLLGTLILQPGGTPKIPTSLAIQTPSQSVKSSSKNALIVGASSWIFFALAFMLFRAQSLGFSDALNDGMLFGMIAGLVGGIIGGGNDILKHFFLRLILWLNRRIPLNYARFLDHCHSLIFLRKVGGGYIFIHRMLMEHFASLTDEDIERIAREVESQRT